MTHPTPRPRTSPRPRVHLGGVDIDDLTLAEALDAIAALVASGKGGTVLTPNVDHVVLVEEDARLREAYASASLSLVDGMPVLWASRLLGTPLREKVSGSDLIRPLLELAAERRLRVYFLGGGPGVAARAAENLHRVIPDLRIAGVDAPRIELDGERVADGEAIARAKAARPDLVLVALGCPKQEIFMHAAAPALRPAVLLGIGAGLDFWAGTIQRAPAWMSARGLEWLYRLAHEPRRLWRRYLVRDPKFLLILLRELRSRAALRAASA
jgi:N-acetylglucosaminyldiphosphoundecaprenol N-acetyl-beta-D-mannosaminyltransferase